MILQNSACECTFVRRSDLLSKVEILIALTFASSRSSVIHASLKSNTPLILVLLHVFFWNDIHDVLSICKSYGHFTISPISSCTHCMRFASFTASPAAWISALALLVDVIGCFRVTQWIGILFIVNIIPVLDLVAAYRIPSYRRGDGTRYIPTVRTVRTVNVPSSPGSRTPSARSPALDH